MQLKSVWQNLSKWHLGYGQWSIVHSRVEIENWVKAVWFGVELVKKSIQTSLLAKSTTVKYPYNNYSYNDNTHYNGKYYTPSNNAIKIMPKRR